MSGDYDLDRELQFHLDERVADLVSRGMDREEASRTARAELGGLTQIKEAIHDHDRWTLLNGLGQDLRLAVRMLRATPLVTLVAVLSLALGIGANTALFSIFDSLLLKSLPVREPAQLVALDCAVPANYFGVGYPVWKGIEQAHIFDGPFAWATDRVHLSDTGEITFANAVWTTGNTFQVLGVAPALGRTLDPSDDRRGGGSGGPVAVLSYGFWQRRFDGAPGAIGQALMIERVPFTIVGVMPPQFLGLNVGTTFDVMLPLETEPLLGRTPKRLDNPTWDWLQVMARLAPGQTPAALSVALRDAQPRIRAATMPPLDYQAGRDRFLADAWTARAAPGGLSPLRRTYETALSTLLAIVGLVLAVACANIAMLMLARTAARRYEFSVRRALGATRARLIRQLLTESALLAAAGAAVGLTFAHWGSRLLVAQLSTWANTAVLDLSPDWRVLGVTSVMAVATAVLFGTAPALRAAAVTPLEALKRQPRVPGAAGGIAGGTLIVVQVTVSVLLVVGTGLFLRSFAALAYRDLGFDRSHVIVAVVDARRSTVPATGRAELYERVRQSVASVPGVDSAAISMATPLGSAGVRFTPQLTDPGNRAFSARPRVLMNPVSPGWFGTFGTRIVSGRDFTAQDRPGAPDVAIVNEAFARRYFAGASPVGRTIVEADTPTNRSAIEIVGLAQDAAFTSAREPVEPTLYRPLAQRVDTRLLTAISSISVSVRARNVASPGLSASLGAAIGDVDRDLGFTFQTLSETLRPYYVRERLLALVSTFFGTLALLMAALGLYGVTACSVNRRRTEIGIGMALGAAPAAIARLVLSRVAALVGLGVLAGVCLSVWASRFVASLLYLVPPRDPGTFISAVAVLTAVGVLAGAVPAWRASRLDPAAVLRES